MKIYFQDQRAKLFGRKTKYILFLATLLLYCFLPHSCILSFKTRMLAMHLLLYIRKYYHERMEMAFVEVGSDISC